MTDVKPAVSFIGLGAMGFGMATHLVKQGYRVTGFDVWPPTLERFAVAGGQTATSPAEAVAGKGYCVCMVATAQQAEAVLFGEPGKEADAAVPALPQGAALLLCSTVPCAYVQSLAHKLATAAGRPDILLVDAPVSGGAARAADGTLSIMAGASDAAMSRANFLLCEMADPAKLYIVPGGIGMGSNMKMVHQVLAAVQILSASEAMGLASQLGLDLRAVHDAVVRSEGASFMFGHRVPRMLDNFQPLASALTIILKDVTIVTSEAGRSGFPTPMAGVAENVYLAALGRGFGPEDDSCMLKIYTEGKGKVGPVAGTTLTDDEKLRLVIDLLRGVHLCSTAEALAFSHRVGIDLDQAFDLFVNAAGGSAMLQTLGPEMIQAFKSGKATQAWPAGGSAASLKAMGQSLEAVVLEAQRLKMPLFLGTTALNIIRAALQASDSAAAASVVRIWSSS